MSQQINLLQHRHRPVGSALGALAMVTVVLLCLLAYDAVLRNETTVLQQDIATGQRQLVQAKAALQVMHQRADSNNDAATLKAEIDTLKSRVEALKQRGELIGNRTLGSPDGYAQHFITLASVPEEGLWLTSVFVSDAGKLMSLGGRALRGESVLRYVKRLNEAFAPLGVQFNSVEMTQENLVRTGAPDKPLLTSVAFRLF